MTMASKNDNLDLSLPGAILELGQAIHAAHGGMRPRPGAAPNAEQMVATEDRVLAMVIASVAARKLMGIRLANQDDAERRLRLRTFAYLANRMLGEQTHNHAEITEVAVAAMDPQLPPAQALLVARHGIGRMVAAGVLDAHPDCRTPWNPDVILPARALQWAAGGRASLGILSPQRLAAARLRCGAGEEPVETDSPVPAPLPARQIRERIAARVIGMEGGQLDVVASRLAMHMSRSRMLAAGKDPGTPNEVVLVMGTESGIGKTFLCEVAGQATGLPCTIANAAEMTSSGYVGQSCEDGLRPLLAAASGRVESCRFGLMCYDEIFRRAGSLNESAVTGTAVQGEMLRLVQGQMTQVGGKRGSFEPPFWVNTHGMFFFLCGCAAGLDRLIQRRMGRLAIGFGSGSGRMGDRAALLDGLERFGIIRELLTRLTAIVVVRPPSLDALCKAATSEHGVIASYSRLLGDAMFFFDDAAVLAMARHCLATKSYFRGLAAITSAVAAEAVMREQKGAVVVAASDVRRGIGRMDEEVADLLGATGRTGLPDDPMPDDVAVDAYGESDGV